jgi:diguanylate cyclase
MPFDKIKIDRSFISDLVTQPDCAAIVQALIGLAGSLNMSITAEGVETAEQLEHLRSRGCGEAQGFLIGRPGPASLFTALLETQNGGKPAQSERAAA